MKSFAWTIAPLAMSISLALHAQNSNSDQPISNVGTLPGKLIDNKNETLTLINTSVVGNENIHKIGAESSSPMSTSQQYSRPTDGVLVDIAGKKYNIIIEDEGYQIITIDLSNNNNSIKKFSIAKDTVNLKPQSIALGGEKVFVANQGVGNIISFDKNNIQTDKIETKIYSEDNTYTGERAIYAKDDNNIYFLAESSKDKKTKIVHYDIKKNSFNEADAPSDASLLKVYNNNIVVAGRHETIKGKIVVYDNLSIKEAPTTIIIQLSPSAMGFDTEGNLYLVGFSPIENSIVKVKKDKEHYVLDEKVIKINDHGGFSDILFKENNLYLVKSSGSDILKFNPIPQPNETIIKKPALPDVTPISTDGYGKSNITIPSDIQEIKCGTDPSNCTTEIQDEIDKLCDKNIANMNIKISSGIYAIKKDIVINNKCNGVHIYGDNVVINGSSLDGNAILIQDAKNITIEGLQVKNTPKGFGIYVQKGENITIKNNMIGGDAPTDGNRQGGIGGAGVKNLTIESNTVSNNSQSGISITAMVGSDHYDTGVTKIKNNLVSHNAMDGILVTSSANATVDNNYVNNNGAAGIEFNARDKYTLKGNINNNKVYLNGKLAPAGQGNGILVEGDKNINPGHIIDIKEIKENTLEGNINFGISVYHYAIVGDISKNTLRTGVQGISVQVLSKVTNIKDNKIYDFATTAITIEGSEVTNVESNIIKNDGLKNDEKESVKAEFGINVLARLEGDVWKKSTVTGFNNNIIENTKVGVQVKGSEIKPNTVPNTVYNVDTPTQNVDFTQSEKDKDTNKLINTLPKTDLGTLVKKIDKQTPVWPPLGNAKKITLGNNAPSEDKTEFSGGISLNKSVAYQQSAVVKQGEAFTIAARIKPTMYVTNARLFAVGYWVPGKDPGTCEDDSAKGGFYMLVSPAKDTSTTTNSTNWYCGWGMKDDSDTGNCRRAGVADRLGSTDTKIMPTDWTIKDWSGDLNMLRPFASDNLSNDGTGTQVTLMENVTFTVPGRLCVTLGYQADNALVFHGEQSMDVVVVEQQQP